VISVRSLPHPLEDERLVVNENELFEKWRTTEGDEHDDVERELVKALRRHAIALCWGFLGEIPYEVVDTAVMQAILYSGNFRGDSMFSTYFWHITHNLCQSYLRKKIVRRGREVPIGEDDDFPAPSEEPPFDLLSAAEELVPLDREILLRKQEGLAEKEIAAALGVNHKTINTRWQRLKLKLLRELKP
jgi:RNA polymerase sigma factor (sigma-70 family)